MIAVVVAAGIAALGVCFAGSWTVQMARPHGGPMSPWMAPLSNLILYGGIAAMAGAAYGVLWLTRPR
jgi:hypothetical protein